MRFCLIFANGDLVAGPAVRAALQYGQPDLIIAADGGARHALTLELTPDVVIGDFDSLSEAELATLRAKGADIRRFSSHKDETDLELALLAAAEAGCTFIRVIGGVGDRLDQTLGNVYLMALPALRGCDVRLVSGKQTAWLAFPGETRIVGQRGDTLSLLPLGGDVQNIRTFGLEYPLHGETLHFGPARGISNVLTDPAAVVMFEAGVLLLIHTVGRA